MPSAPPVTSGVERSSPDRRSILPLALLLVVHLALAAPAFDPPESFPGHFAADLARVWDVEHEQGRAWRDRDVEYPPLLVAEIEAIGVEDFDETGRRLALSQIVLHLAAAAALGLGWHRRGAAAYLTITLPFVAYPFVFLRTDMLAVAIACAGAAAWKRRNDSAAGVLLALAFFAKAWPLVLGGALVATRRWRAVATWGGVLVVGVVAWVAYGGVDALRQVFTFRGATGAQIESLPANLIGIVSDEAWRQESGAIRVGDLPGFVRLGLPAIGLGIAAGAWALVWRRVRAGVDSLAFGAGALAAVSGVLCTALLFSTQFTAWLLPWAAVVAAELPGRERWGDPLHRLDLVAVALAVVMAAAAGPLMWIHPDVGHGEPGLWLLTARNIALVALLVVSVRRLWVLEPDAGPAAPS